MRRRSRIVLAITLIAASTAHGQADTSRASRRLSITALVGSASSSTMPAVEQAMSSAGYREDFGGCDFFLCVPTRPGPESYTHANPSLFVFRYELAAGRAVELLWGGAASGTTSGRSSSEILDIAHGGTLLAPMVSLGSGLRVAGGPALLFSHWDYRSPDSPSNGAPERVRTTSFGFVGGASLRWPARSRFFAEAAAQYRAFNPVMVRSSQSARPAGRFSVSHSYVGAGVGLSLY